MFRLSVQYNKLVIKCTESSTEIKFVVCKNSQGKSKVNLLYLHATLNTTTKCTLSFRIQQIFRKNFCSIYCKVVMSVVSSKVSIE